MSAELDHKARLAEVLAEFPPVLPRELDDAAVDGLNTENARVELEAAPAAVIAPKKSRRTKPAPQPRLQAIRAADVMCEPQPVAVIAGLGWAKRITIVVAESGVGKTFVFLGAAASVGDGVDFHGLAVSRGSSAYVAYEGDAFGLRLQALREAGFTLEDVHIIRANDPLSPVTGRDGTERASMGEASLAEALANLQAQIVATGRPPLALIIIDTIRASMGGSEDNSADASAYLRAVRRIMAPHPAAAAILVHHAGWQDGEQKRKRERGSSAFRGNADATLYLEVTEEDPEHHLAYLTLRTLKVRDDERPAPLRLVRRRVAVQQLDDEGQPRTTCIIEKDSRRHEDIEAESAKQAAAQEADLERRALEAIANPNNKVTSIATLRGLIKCGQPAAAELLPRLMATGKIARASQREPYRVVPTRTPGEPGTTTESYRTPPPIGGTGTNRVRGNGKGRKKSNRTGRKEARP